MIDKEIIKIASNTENHGVLDNHTHFSRLKNSICGDEMKVYLIIEDNKILDFKYIFPKTDKFEFILGGSFLTQENSNFGEAFKLSTELVAAVAVGTIIGFILDNWFGTKPWLILIFFFVGVIAGISNVIRSAKNMQK